MGKGGKHHLGLEEPKLRPPPARVREGRVWLEGGRTVKGVSQQEGQEHCCEIHVLCACRRSTF